MLNPEQKAAVTYTDGPLLVLAGAGSGKTRVIIHKIVHLIEKNHCKAHQIAAVTFTNKAAQEMKHRIQSLLPTTTRRGLKIATFHTLGLQLLKQMPEPYGFNKTFSIMDSEDSLGIIQSFLPPARRRDRTELLHIQQYISRWKNALQTPSMVSGDAEMIDFFAKYEQTLRTYQAVDFDDLIGLPVMLLQQHDALREYWQRRIRYLLIDEYQDSNHAQYQFVRLLAGDTGAFTAVGDDAQSIYAWRGAKPENLLQLEQDFPNLKCIKLEQNYRSTGHILHTANQLMTHNKALFEKRLWSEWGPGDLIRVLCCKDGQDEAEQVIADLINHKLRHQYPYHHYAILYRGNHQARLFENTLRAQGIPYRLTGGESWFSRTEIKDILAYLRLLCHDTDDMAFIRVCNTPKRGIGTQTLEALSQYAKDKPQGLFQCSHHLGFLSLLNDKSRRAMNTFHQWFSTYQTRSQHESMVPLLYDMIKTMNYEDHLYDLHESPQKAQRCLEHVYELIQWIEKLLEKNPTHHLSDVLNTLMLIDLLDQNKDNDQEAVQLMTLHASKGLEFPCVYLVGMEEDLLPHRTSIEANHVEEERRLAYVGITRAQKWLTLSMAKQRRRAGALYHCTPSRFLDELPDSCLEWFGRHAATPEQAKARAETHLAGLRALLEMRS